MGSNQIEERWMWSHVVRCMSLARLSVETLAVVYHRRLQPPLAEFYPTAPRRIARCFATFLCAILSAWSIQAATAQTQGDSSTSGDGTNAETTGSTSPETGAPCYTMRCRASELGWPMIQTFNAPCPPEYPFSAGRTDISHGQAVERITLSAGDTSGEAVPCLDPNAAAFCNDPGKSGFIFSTQAASELITAEEYSTRETFICDNGGLRAGSTLMVDVTPTAAAAPQEGSGATGESTTSGETSADGTTEAATTTTDTGANPDVEQQEMLIAEDPLPECSFGSCPGVMLLEPCLAGSPETCTPPNHISHAGFCSNYPCDQSDSSTTTTTTTGDPLAVESGTTTGRGATDGVTTDGADTTTTDATTGDPAVVESGTTSGSGEAEGVDTGTDQGCGRVYSKMCCSGQDREATNSCQLADLQNLGCTIGACGATTDAGTDSGAGGNSTVTDAGTGTGISTDSGLDTSTSDSDSSSTGDPVVVESGTTSGSGVADGVTTGGDGSVTTTGADATTSDSTTGDPVVVESGTAFGSGVAEGVTTGGDGSTTAAGTGTATPDATTGDPLVGESGATSGGGVAEGVTTGGDSSTTVTAADTATSDATTADTTGVTTDLPELVESGTTAEGGATEGGSSSGDSSSTVTAADATTSDATTADETGATTGDPIVVESGTTTDGGTSGGMTTGEEGSANDSATGTSSVTGGGAVTGEASESGSGEMPTSGGAGSDETTGDGGSDVGIQGGQLTVEPACVMQNVDGARTAYFSYDNMSGHEMAVLTNPTTGAINELVANGEQLPPLTSFSPGRHVGVFAVTFRGASLEWQVKPAASGPTTARIDASTIACAPVRPLGECKRIVVDNQLALLGYENPNPFTIHIPVGPLNKLTPGDPERGQPAEFKPGLNNGVASVKINDSPTWNLNGLEAQLGSSLKDCHSDCVDANTAVIISNLDTVALELTNVAKRAALQLAKARPAENDRRNLKARLASARLDAQRSAARSERYLKLARAVTIDWPLVTAACPNRAKVCRSVDRSESIAKLRDLYARARGLTTRAVTRAKFITYGKRQRSNPLIRRARRLEMIGNEQLSKLPRVVEDCR